MLLRSHLNAAVNFNRVTINLFRVVHGHGGLENEHQIEILLCLRLLEKQHVASIFKDHIAIASAPEKHYSL